MVFVRLIDIFGISLLKLHVGRVTHCEDFGLDELMYYDDYVLDVVT